MSPIKREQEVSKNEGYAFWHTSKPDSLVGPLIICLRQTLQEIYGERYSPDLVQEASRSYRIYTLHPIRITQLKIYIDNDLYDRKLTQIFVTVDHNISVEQFPAFVNAIRQTLGNL